MKTALKKFKGIGLLSLMIVVSVGVVFVVNQLRESSKGVVANQRVQQVSVVQEQDKKIAMDDSSIPLEVTYELEGLEEELLAIALQFRDSSPSERMGQIQALSPTGEEMIIGDTSIPIEVVEEFVKGKMEAEEAVLGDEDGTEYKNTCNNENHTYIISESACIRDGSARLEFTKEMGASKKGSGEMVSLDSKVVLAEVTSPLELISGVEVADSNRMITTDTPTLKPAGEQVESAIANVLLPPGEQIDEYREWDEDKPFKFDFWTAFGDTIATKSEDGEIAVEEEIENECAECKNPSNVNPDKSNKISEFIYESAYKFPGERDEEKEEDVEEDYNDCRDSTFNEWSGDYEVCKIGLVQNLLERIKSISLWNQFLSILNFLKCEFLNHRDCISIEDIVIIMDSPFGSDKGCLEGSACTNAFMNTRNQVVLSPGTDPVEKHYYTTPCKAYVQGASGLQDIKCAWDLSHLFKERKYNEFDDFPNTESTPSENEYNDFLLKKIQGERGDAIDIKSGN
jgi:hypothetical protein